MVESIGSFMEKKPRLESGPIDVDHRIDPASDSTVASVFDEVIRKYGEKVAFRAFGHALTLVPRFGM